MDNEQSSPIDPASKAPAEIMTLQEVADYLGLHYLTIYRLIQERKIPAAKIGGSWRFRKDVLDEWIKNDMHRRFKNNRSKRVA
ncbi:MAG TPA: helix-turn-helix domain-containing protein [Verrucomicrobiae bacterium]|jgi:excisionase family DNA binding protein|nr:helix-turn-helix domain-containing protein [Verrucomicrobiae bacterium]